MTVLLLSPGVLQAGFNSDAQGLALKGYDAVAYFTESAAVPGTAEHEVAWQGVKWRFKNEENKALFAADPEKYAPQYGGYCAFAVSRGATADGDPNAWSIEGGKLYLNLNARIRSRWQQNARANIESADKNWPNIS
ncbi:MAG: YHS domain-containing (seleno)protein [Candidatus Omnitrophota bacterium]|nr:YHS domain-containing (seleno)protein [Candidatus Omnitrophota bacterium]